MLLIVPDNSKDQERGRGCQVTLNPGLRRPTPTYTADVTRRSLSGHWDSPATGSVHAILGRPGNSGVPLHIAQQVVSRYASFVDDGERRPEAKRFSFKQERRQVEKVQVVGSMLSPAE